MAQTLGCHLVLDTPENRAEVAAIVAAWEVAKEFVSKEVEISLDQGSREGSWCFVRIRDTQFGLLALKAEEIELNEPTASPLDLVISKTPRAHGSNPPWLNNTGSFSGKSNSQGFKGKGKGKGGKSKGKDSRLAGLQMGVICASHTMVATAMASATECISAELRDATVIILQCNARMGDKNNSALPQSSAPGASVGNKALETQQHATVVDLTRLSTPTTWTSVGVT
ncbi:unnamed protein product [Cladocopium goreaui]|uniref:Retrovirus-related Pol polyprotein from transposon TNT 1-94 n=1 Tax=Cladocopium goreaui TaxID=2562237 RepID=A0A9P1CC64_9DINO|nr:unnamed protein product [Cladocopium goreaui]